MGSSGVGEAHISCIKGEGARTAQGFGRGYRGEGGRVAASPPDGRCADVSR